jgi:alpha-beta hydrolase superfamily lysophospholipase
MKTLLKQTGLFVLYGTLGVLVALVVVAAVYLESREDLAVWHTVALDEEFHAGLGLERFSEYLALESRLFDELEREVVAVVGEGRALNRYSRDSLSSPGRWPANWNRSFELVADAPRAGVLMLHGMSDSPYSMRALAERLQRDGVHVLALRYPGHGTAPASLARTTWEDMAAAVRLAAHHLETALDGAPVFVFGYSTGGPLAVELVLAADDGVAAPDGLVLFSPAMGLTPLAALAPWQDRLGRLLGLEKFEWNTIELEYDPFKYRSFPLNAAIQVWRLSTHVRSLVGEAAESGRLAAMPPVLTFQSVADSTIDAPALADVLYNRLPEGGHRLVVYDLNRSAGMEALIANDPTPVLDRLLADETLRYEFALITSTPDGAAMMREGVRSGRADCGLDARWPRGVYSLSHVALTFPPDDPLYGGPDAQPSAGVQLGNVALRGESSALRISPGGLLRQSWNPFFDTQYAELTYFMGLTERPPCDRPPALRPEATRR